MKIIELINILEELSPPQLQESYDNSGLLLGNINDEIKSVLISLDITENVVNEAIKTNCNVIVSHHPLIFKGLKKITGSNYIERILINAIKNNIAIYSCHTNIDKTNPGVNYALAQKLELENIRVLSPEKNNLKKIVVFVPLSHANEVRNAIFKSGGGHIGNYDSCSYNLAGYGTFRGLDAANPFVGQKGEVHKEEEIRIETVVPSFYVNHVINEMIKAHPYEEVAYDIYNLDNENSKYGLGAVGILKNEVDETIFLNDLKKKLSLKYIKHSNLIGKKIKKVAVCGGSGADFLHLAIKSKADVFITGDTKYHNYFDVDNKLLLIDCGHYETEVFILEVIYNYLLKKIPNFAVQISKHNTNPINYY